jgi:hypothetical protein
MAPVFTTAVTRFIIYRVIKFYFLLAIDLKKFKFVISHVFQQLYLILINITLVRTRFFLGLALDTIQTIAKKQTRANVVRRLVQWRRLEANLRRKIFTLK